MGPFSLGGAYWRRSGPTMAMGGAVEWMRNGQASECDQFSTSRATITSEKTLSMAFDDVRSS